MSDEPLSGPGPRATQKRVLSEWRADGAAILRILDGESGRAVSTLGHALEDLTHGFEETSRSQETLQIDGKAVPCDRVTYSGLRQAGQQSATMKVWFGKGITLPPRELRISLSRVCRVDPGVVRIVRTELGERATLTSTLHVKKLGEVVQIRNQGYECAVEEVAATTEGPGGFERRGERRWICDSVPGRVARMERECTNVPSVAPGSYTHKHEILDFKH